MRIIAKDKKEFDTAEAFIKKLGIDQKLINTIEFNNLLDRFEIITHKNFQNELKIYIPKSWEFSRIFTMEKNEGTHHICILCKGMTLIYPNSSNKFVLDLYDDKMLTYNK